MPKTHPWRATAFYGSVRVRISKYSTFVPNTRLYANTLHMFCVVFFLFARFRAQHLSSRSAAWTVLHIAKLQPLFYVDAPWVNIIGEIAFIIFINDEHRGLSYFMFLGIGIFCEVALRFFVYCTHILHHKLSIFSEKHRYNLHAWYDRPSQYYPMHMSNILTVGF